MPIPVNLGDTSAIIYFIYLTAAVLILILQGGRSSNIIMMRFHFGEVMDICRISRHHRYVLLRVHGRICNDMT